MNDLEKRDENRTVTIQPSCAICEEDGKVKLRLEMPGICKEDIEVSVEKNELAISAKSKAQPVTGAYLFRERRVGEYRKRFIIDETIDREKIEASMANGVLTLSLTIKEAAKPRKVEIA
jgi:HSP20 family protein